MMSTMPSPVDRPEAFRRVQTWLADAGHPNEPRWLERSARTAQEAADSLGVVVGQIAKSIVFRRVADDAVVLVVASGDRRVDEAKVAQRVGPLSRADAAFVKTRTGFAIGGVAPVAHRLPEGTAMVTLIDEQLFRFGTVWAAAGHPNGVFEIAPLDLQRHTGAPVADVTP
jgi:prolyl-tRNA editing enzyme YbaK/EbsC (Cys-tRNA(Pro) deacylase)